MKMTDKSIKIVKTGNPGDTNRFLIAAMPDGTAIPMQLDLTFRQPLKTPDFVKVEISLECYVPIDEFEVLEKDPRITIEEPKPKKETKFRGLSKDKNELVYGYYFRTEEEETGKLEAFICPIGADFDVNVVEIFPESVEQFTGETDAQGKEIYS